MKKIRLLLFVMVLLLIGNPEISANSINSVDINMVIDEFGNAIVTEIWDTKTNDKTEIYRPLGDLGNSVISDYSVMMGNRKFTYVDNWDADGSFNDKAYKNGISSKNEMCFGISKYGSNVYTVTYKVSNVIYNASDSQFLYWKFINGGMNNPPKNISIKIKSFYNFEDSLDVWGYGYKGYAYVSNGVIEASNEDTLGDDMYAVLLVKFPLNTFTTSNSIYKYKTFNDVYNEAEKGTFDYDYDNNKSDGLFSKINFISGLLIDIAPIAIVAGIIIGFRKFFKSYKKYQREKIDKKTLNNFRDIPCDKDIYKAYFLSDVYSLNSKKTDFMGALLLRWLKNEQIRIVETEKKRLFKTDKVLSFDMSKELITDSVLEKEMYDILVEASKDNILESNELEKWCKNNYEEYFEWFDKLLSECADKYKTEGLIVNEIVKNKKTQVCSVKFHEEAVHLAGLKKYLEEFSQMNEKSAIEVHLWDEYLMFAQIFGIADRVAEQFKKLYPELLENSNFNYDLNTFILISHISNNTYSSASSARSAAQSYSAGGGGFSSGGGGGGSFGGGSGGGFR